jgi:hypothetical protein
MALNLVGPMGELAEGDRECQPLVEFHAHLEQVADLASAGERIPRRLILRTAVVGDAWLVAIDEQPVFVDGSAAVGVCVRCGRRARPLVRGRRDGTHA